MEQRDYLKDQIDQMGKVLAKILGDLMGLKTKNDPQRTLTHVDQELKTQVDFELENFLKMSADERRVYAEREVFAASNLETLAEILREMGAVASENSSNYVSDYFKAARDMLNCADEKSGAISLERIQKKQTLENLIEQHA